MTCISNQYKVEIAVFFIPSQIYTTEIRPYSFGRTSPLFCTSPFQSIQISKHSWSINDKIILSIVYECLYSLIEQSFEFLSITSRKISRKIIIHLLVVVNIVHPIRNSKVRFLLLKVVSIEGIYITLIILLIVENVHAIVILICYVVIGDDKVYVPCCLFQIAVCDASDGLVLHKSSCISPLP